MQIKEDTNPISFPFSFFLLFLSPLLSQHYLHIHVYSPFFLTCILTIYFAFSNTRIYDFLMSQNQALHKWYIPTIAEFCGTAMFLFLAVGGADASTRGAAE